uniref:(northern house mosquito) hypothetical protein n=1 Tax=Culex pipiens TaxID=7175 RepID=A0A8D8F300_CULPI
MNGTIVPTEVKSSRNVRSTLRLRRRFRNHRRWHVVVVPAQTLVRGIGLRAVQFQLVQVRVDQHVQHAGQLGDDEPEHVQQEALAVPEAEHGGLQGGTRAQLGADFGL